MDFLHQVFEPMFSLTENSASTSSNSNKVTVSASTQCLSSGANGGVAKSEASTSKTTDDVKETPC